MVAVWVLLSQEAVVEQGRLSCTKPSSQDVSASVSGLDLLHSSPPAFIGVVLATPAQQRVLELTPHSDA